MIDIRINKQPYQIPRNLHDVKLSRWIEYIEFLQDNQPDFLQPTFEEDDFDKERPIYRTLSDLSKREKMMFFEYQCKEIAFWTGCEISILRRHPLTEIFGLWEIMQVGLQPSEDKGFSFFDLDGERYHCPTRLMQDSTLEDYAEANEYEKHCAQLENGNLHALFYVAAVICRKSGEGYDDYKVDKRVKLFQEHLTAYDAMQVGFFLQRLSVKSITDFQIFTTSQALARLKQVSNS